MEGNAHRRNCRYKVVEAGKIMVCAVNYLYTVNYLKFNICVGEIGGNQVVRP